MADLLSQAIAAVKAGDKATGKRLLAQFVKTEPNHVNAWLWLSVVVDQPAQRRQCLEKVLSIQPDHAQASAALAKMQAAAPPASSQPSIQTPPFRETTDIPTSPLRRPAVATPPPAPRQPHGLFPDLEEEPEKLPDWMPPLEETTSGRRAFQPSPDDYNEEIPPGTTDNAFEKPDSDRVAIPAWMDNLYNPLHTTPRASPEQPKERSFWEIPLAETTEAARQAADARRASKRSGKGKEAPAEFDAWAVPLAETSQATLEEQETSKQLNRRSGGRGYRWQAIFGAVLISSSVESFEFVLSDPALSLKRALVWMFWASCIQYAVIYGLGSIVGLPLPTQQVAAGSIGPLLGILLSPVAAALYILAFMLQVGVQQIGAIALGGRGRYRELAYAIAAYEAPMLLIYTILTFAPYLVLFFPSSEDWIFIVIGFIGIVLGLYIFSLTINAYRVVHQFSTGRAIAAILMPSVLVLSAICCLAVLITP